jgi:hypothetical protein
LAISSLLSKQVCPVETVFAGVRLTWKSQSTNILGEIPWVIGLSVLISWGNFSSLRLKLGVTCHSCFVQRKGVLILVF